MPGFELDRWAPRIGTRFRVLPVVHDSLEMAAWVRWALEELEVAAVAVELPRSFTGGVQRAVRRLPKISAVFDVVPEGAAVRLFVCSPGDAFAEALRFAQERELPSALVDADVEVDELNDEVPDTYSLWDLGAAHYSSLLEAALETTPLPPTADLRERLMACRIQELAETAEGSGDVVAVVGAAHANRLRELLLNPQPRPLVRELRREVDIRHVHPESLAAMVPEAPVLHAAWELLRQGEVPEPPLPRAVQSPKLSLEVSGNRLQLVKGGDVPAKDGDLKRSRDLSVAEYVAHYSARSIGECTPAPDRLLAERSLWQVAANSYREQTLTSVAPWQRRIYIDFSRRYSRVQGRLAGGLYEWVIAARGVADDVFAWEIFDAARCYPWQYGPQELQSVSVDGDELDLGTRRIKFRRWSFRVKRPLNLKPRPLPDDPEEWLKGFDGGLCSYPPEDLIIEDFGKDLSRRGVAVLTTERERTTRFQSGLLDGIDLRETVRKRTSQVLRPGPALWVREESRSPGACSTVVMIFDEDEGRKEDFPYRMTWLGEHEDESDMAFYSTPPLEQIVGPGITRSTYGGLMMNRPPGRLYDVWKDPDYEGMGSKAELLLLAAIDYSEERIVAHIGRRPPASWIAGHARRQGKQIVHLPLASMSPRTLAKVRVVHLLAGRDKRDLAPRYIW